MNDTFEMPPQALYRFFDGSDVLLYVGITLDLPVRLKHHSVHKPWWTEVSRIDVEHFESQIEVVEAERAAIIAESPKYNLVHNAHRRPRDLVAIELRKSGRTWPQIQKELGVSARTMRRIAERLRKAGLVPRNPTRLVSQP
jgi:hypothetical protein